MRVRHTLEIAWRGDVQGHEVFLPDAWFEENPLRDLDGQLNQSFIATGGG